MSNSTRDLLLTKAIHKVQTTLRQNPTTFNDLKILGVASPQRLGEVVGHMLSTGMINATFYINSTETGDEVRR